MQPLYLEDAYLKAFVTKVQSIIDDNFVVLEKTAFYPNGGGQPYDTGNLIRRKDNVAFRVIGVEKVSGQISHEAESGLKERDEVIGNIDWDRRYKLMKTHTAAHIVSQVIFNKTGAKITGGNLTLEKARIDFSTENFSQELMKEVIDEANNVISKNLDTKTYTVPRDEAEKLTKLAMGLPPDIQEVRIVQIGDFDIQADGGTHVKNTSEIGNLAFMKAENKGKSFRRLYFKLKENNNGADGLSL